MAENPWKVDVEKALGSRPDIMLWNQQAGIWAPVSNTRLRVRVAPDGIGDIMGLQLRRFHKEHAKIIEIMRPHSFNPHEAEIQHFYGQAFAIETKDKGRTQRESQENFEDAFTAMHGVYIVAHLGRWDVIWDTFGREADPLCAAEGQRRWAEIKARRDAEAAAKPVSGARRRAKR